MIKSALGSGKVRSCSRVNDPQRKKEWTWDRICFCICLVLKRMEAIDLSGIAKRESVNLVFSTLKHCFESNLMLWPYQMFAPWFEFSATYFSIMNILI